MPEPSIPTCLKCGYSLQALTEPRCPECGQAFDPTYVAEFESRKLLLPWERPEIGGVIKRTIKTVWMGCTHPAQFFAAVEKRTNRPIDRPGLLILAIVAATLLVHLAGKISLTLWSVAHMTIRSGNFPVAFRVACQSRAYGLKYEWYEPSYFISSWLAAIFLSSLLLFMVGKKQSPSIRLVDYLVLLAPICVFDGVVKAVFMLIGVSYQSILEPVAYVTAWVPLLLFVVVVWQCSRRLLKTRRAPALGLSLICLGFAYYSGWLVNLVLIPIFETQLPVT